MSKHLRGYFTSYVKREALEDPHVPMFRALKKQIKISTVLYPGSFRHLTPSFFFPTVHYVDFDPKVGEIFSDAKAVAFVEANKEYEEPLKMIFHCEDYSSLDTKSVETPELLISLNAGIISKPCGKFLKPGGYFLVNDGHSDARTTFLDGSFKLVGVYDESSQTFLTEEKLLQEYFHTKTGRVTHEMVAESLSKPASKLSYRFKKESGYYL